MKTEPAHGTDNEKRFIARLGSHAGESLSRHFTRAELLRGYLAGCRKRADWAGMDREKVMIFAMDELERERGEVSAK